MLGVKVSLAIAGSDVFGDIALNKSLFGAAADSSPEQVERAMPTRSAAIATVGLALHGGNGKPAAKDVHEPTQLQSNLNT